MVEVVGSRDPVVQALARSVNLSVETPVGIGEGG